MNRIDIETGFKTTSIRIFNIFFNLLAFYSRLKIFFLNSLHYKLSLYLGSLIIYRIMLLYFTFRMHVRIIHVEKMKCALTRRAQWLAWGGADVHLNNLEHAVSLLQWQEQSTTRNSLGNIPMW